MVSRFSRQNDVGLRALNIAPWENLVLVVILVLESKALYKRPSDWSTRTTTSTSFKFWPHAHRKYSPSKPKARAQYGKLVLVVVLVRQSEGRY